MIDLLTSETFISVTNAMASAGISANEAARNLQAALSAMPPIDPGKVEAMIRVNPSLSRLQRWQLIQELRRTKNGQ